MSHFAVMVISRDAYDVDELLSRYDENKVVPKYVEYTKEQAIAEARKRNNEHLEFWTNHLVKLNLAEEKNEEQISTARMNVDDYTKRLTWDDETCYNSIAEYYDPENIRPNGDLLSSYNPDSKWDWYATGGRWAGFLKTRDGEKVDDGWAKDIDFTPDRRSWERAAKWWEEKIENPDSEKTDNPFHPNPEYYIAKYKDKETYARIMSLPITRAVVTMDGEWHEKGEMGWWGMSSETAEESLDWDLAFMDRFIKPAIDADAYITIVDCHI